MATSSAKPSGIIALGCVPRTPHQLGQRNGGSLECQLGFENNLFWNAACSTNESKLLFVINYLSASATFSSDLGFFFERDTS